MKFCNGSLSCLRHPFTLSLHIHIYWEGYSKDSETSFRTAPVPRSLLLEVNGKVCWIKEAYIPACLLQPWDRQSLLSRTEEESVRTRNFCDSYIYFEFENCFCQQAKKNNWVNSFGKYSLCPYICRKLSYFPTLCFIFTYYSKKGVTGE